MDALAEREWTAWQELVDSLKAAGAVTEADCKSPASKPPETPGEKVFDALRRWGESKSAIASIQ